ncbi:uncharacterized protein LOC121776405 [Salvia splendens]|uniref:uncharacterized protein LOC121776405 n=1 Tax=Salvia splendens TaxID=180675 RepID=UPI001C259719|nr:uncharacterized protein LOC121776405 [Salvia splendens]
MEPLTTPNPDRYSKALGQKFKGANTNGKVWIFTKEGAHFDIEEDGDQILHGKLTSQRMTCPIFVSAVYAKCSRLERYPLWDKMRDISNLVDGMPWLIGGDFNSILSHADQVGSDTNRQGEMIDFAETIEDCRLLDPGYDGAEYTWAKKGLFERLERMFVSPPKIFQASRVTNLLRVSSDHGPILARPRLLGATHRGGRAPKSPNQVYTKQKSLKDMEQRVFGNIHANPTRMEEEIAKAQANFEADRTLWNRTQINKNIAEYILLLDGGGFLATKDGLEVACRGRQEFQILSKLGETEEGQGLLAPNIPAALEEPDLDLIHQIPPLDDLTNLHKAPDSGEVKRAVFEIFGDSAPGPDGFSATFYQACWSIVGRDVVKRSLSFSKGLTSPEVSRPQT